MEQPAQYLNNCWLLMLLLLQCNAEHQQLQLALKNADSVNWNSSKGIMYVEGQVYTGTLYKLFANATDTL